MSDSSSSDSSEENSNARFLGQRGKTVLWCLLLLGLGYAAGHSFWYAATPMGMYPVLDSKENLLLAKDIAENRLPAEPFYRAPGYPLVLSIAVKLGLPEILLPDWARLVNLLSWLISLWLIWRLAIELWGDISAGIVACLIWALYPVGLFFMVDPLDITLAVALMLAGLDRALAFLKSANAQNALASGFLLALAGLTRPQMWSIALVVPCLMCLLVWLDCRRQKVDAASTSERKAPCWPVFVVWIGLAIPALTMGIFNAQLSGSFKVLPTQGPFNLWAANRPDSHGKYYTQQIEINQSERHVNPARIESLLMYRKDIGDDAPADVASVNDYWRGRFFKMVSDDPVGFFRRLAAKTYYLFNNYEQYNNKTFAVHHGLSPWLRWNFLGWGLLMTAALPLLLWGRKNRLSFTILAGAALAYTAGVVLTYVSARFRIPLVPLLAVFAGGWGIMPWSRLGFDQIAAGLCLMLAGAVLTFSNFWQVREPVTEIQDYLLLGYAALDAGEDEEALMWSQEALEVNPLRHAAQELEVIARYNLDLAALPDRPSGEQLEKRIAVAAALDKYSPRVAYIYGVYLHWNGDTSAAQAQWLSLIGLNNSLSQEAMTALVMTDGLPNELKMRIVAIPDSQLSPQLRVATQMSAGGGGVPTGLPNGSDANLLARQLVMLFY
ncbi:hypothetical protein [Rubellicoccus peritrichatus]|uniref:Glycosyltransferase RgtA/B/C/D-like domain-containing protein n=1 Tax=Rubellicoccus peritrichatus TaxID=3080537 RepID=A0AAQ3QRF5_9BACT|nr:hypothetical protein [Puniceicoccus sp. CR14]WOO41273.1 hypothetical protein RZN69_21850 [Puniceicoccus sp. CR14]